MFDDADDYLADLTDRSSAGYEPARRDRAPHPKGFEPGVVREAGRWTVTTPPMEHLGDEAAWQTALDALQVQVPPGWVVRLVEMRYDPVAWTRDDPDQVYAITKPVWRYRFAVEAAPDSDTNIDELVKSLARVRVGTRLPRTSDGTLVVAWNDWQLFKAIGDGIEGTVRRVRESFGVVTDRQRELRKLGRQYNRLLVVASGDIVEGCAIFPHHAWELQGDSRDQENAARRLIVDGLKHFAKHFDAVQVLVVGGNHGENRIDGKKINRHDNSDVKVFEQAADILLENEAFAHVTFHIPHEDLAATIEVEGWVLATTHGHIAGKGAGNPEVKIFNWFKGQAAGKKPAGDADILVTSHFHHRRLADWGGCVWMQAPTMDGGSPQHSDLTGMDARPGVLTFGVTTTQRVTDYEVTEL